MYEWEAEPKSPLIVYRDTLRPNAGTGYTLERRLGWMYIISRTHMEPFESSRLTLSAGQSLITDEALARHMGVNVAAAARFRKRLVSDRLVTVELFAHHRRKYWIYTLRSGLEFQLLQAYKEHGSEYGTLIGWVASFGGRDPIAVLAEQHMDEQLRGL